MDKLNPQVVLANPRGFCAGVDRAIAIVERALELFGAPIYVRHEVVHNRFVVDNLRAKGAVFIEQLDEVPDGATLIFSAHGVPKSVQQAATARGFRIFDATCPLVTKVHLAVARYARDGIDVVLIGHAGHPEVEGTMGQFSSTTGGTIHLVETAADVAALQVQDPERLAFVTQTTLSMDDAVGLIEALRARFPAIQGPRTDDICYATQSRQDAVKRLAAECDRILVVGSPNSSNSNRLREVAERMGTSAYLIDNAEQIDPAWLSGCQRVGITAGASAPEVLVERVVARLAELGLHGVEDDPSLREQVVFSLPKTLL